MRKNIIIGAVAVAALTLAVAAGGSDNDRWYPHDLPDPGHVSRLIDGEYVHVDDEYQK
jgi:hypothetical protein